MEIPNDLGEERIQGFISGTKMVTSYGSSDKRLGGTTIMMSEGDPEGSGDLPLRIIVSSGIAITDINGDGNREILAI